MNRDPFLVTVGDLSPNHVASKRVHIEATPGWHVEFSQLVDDPPLGFQGDITLTSGGLVVRGSLYGTVRHTCTRCLTEWEDIVAVEVAQLIAGSSTANDQDEDYRYSGDVVDLQQVLRDELLLAVPLLPSCPDGCERLVEVPRSDLNTSSPDDSGESVSPFSVLKDLLDREQ